MIRRLYAFAILLLVSFSAINASAQISAKSKVPDEARQFNQALLTDMLKRDADAVVEKSLDEVKALDDFESSLNKFMSYLPAYEAEKTYDVLSTEVRQTADTGTIELIYKTQYELTNLNLPDEFTDEWALVEIYSQETAEGLKFRHFEFQTSKIQPTTIGDFGFKNKSITHYIFLVFLIAVPVFIIATIIAIIRNKHMTKKWLWGLFASVGLWGFNLNWTTGKISTEFVEITENSFQLKIISFQLFGAGILKAATYSSYIITIAFPIGAILYWVLKHKDKSVPMTFE
jgi:hypothetical protein